MRKIIIKFRVDEQKWKEAVARGINIAAEDEQGCVTADDIRPSQGGIYDPCDVINGCSCLWAEDIEVIA